MSKKDNNTRRSFIKKLGSTGVLVAGGSLALDSFAGPNEFLQQRKSTAANDKIRVACIGMGIMGFGNAETATKVPGVELVAVCDLYDGRLVRAKEIYGKDLFTTRDYKEILDRKDIDAVIISTPDHWHDKISIDAMEKGKAVFCEKPMVHKLEEGLKVIETQKKTKAVFQVGSQRVSSLIFEKAKQLYEAGEIGELNLVVANMDRHDALGAWQYSIPPDASKETLDWDTFLGDAPKVPFDPVRFFRWRNYRDYGTGVPGDLFVHLISGLHFMTGSFGPTRVMAMGGLHMWKDGRDVPDLVTALFDYPKTDKNPAFTANLRVNFADGSGGGETTKLVGNEGEMEISWNSLIIRKHKLPKAPGYGGWDSFDTFPEATQKEFVKQYNAKYPDTRPAINSPKEYVYTNPKGYDERLDHFINFFEAMRSGKTVVEDASFGLRAAGPALATNLSYFDKKIINWDPVKMKLV
ncbi:MAG TPA: Gfo/Idh/MocA family oxidoreductase [Cytophagales bacterium]|nr:Gfo/Idh/MocA family oxidoreductase [Cytophagales bacterium]